MNIQKKRLLLISNMYPDDTNPNYGVFVKNTEEILNSSNYKIDKVVMFKNNNKLKKVFSYLKHYINILVIGTKYNYDIIYVHYASHNAIPILFLKLLKKDIKICTNIHGGDVMPRSKVNLALQHFVKRLLEISDVVISPSLNYKKFIENKYGLCNEQVKVFPSGGIDKNVFYPEKEYCTENKCIGYVGRIENQKGWEIFLELIKEIKDMEEFKEFKYIVVGNGNQEKNFNSKLKELKLENKIQRYRKLEQKDLRKIYNQIDILCFPTFNESLGLVGLESMACGTPVIGSNVGGLKDYIINEKNGYLFEKGNAIDLKANLIKHINKNYEEKQIIMKNAISTAKKYEVENIKKILIGIFENI